ncbi:MULTISPECIES: helix-turn-helix domain-containing protein [Rhodococcus]|nr:MULTISPECIES: helix-turn-helix domain-containing protein [Rhodococcus]
MAESVDLVARVDGAADLRGVVGCPSPTVPERFHPHCVFVFFVLWWGMGAGMNHTVLPPATDDRDLLAALKAVLTGHEQVSISTPEGSVPLPDSVLGLLVDAVTALDQGQAVTVEPHRTVLTTQEAAELLGITRPTLVRLLEAGKIPYTSPGRHRRVELADVLEYLQRERVRRGQVFDEMAHEETPDPGDATDGFVSTR